MLSFVCFFFVDYKATYAYDLAITAYSGSDVFSESCINLLSETYFHSFPSVHLNTYFVMF